VSRVSIKHTCRVTPDHGSSAVCTCVEAEIERLTREIGELRRDYVSMKEGEIVDAELGRKLIQQRDAALARVADLEAAGTRAQGLEEAAWERGNRAGIEEAAEYLSQWAGYMISLNTIANVRALAQRGEGA
jgi:hypothetical protein